MQATGAKVILSSTWRVDPVGLLAAKYYQVPFDDVCPDMPGAPRCEELLTWLRQHPEVIRYVYWTMTTTASTNFLCSNRLKDRAD